MDCLERRERWIRAGFLQYKLLKTLSIELGYEKLLWRVRNQLVWVKGEKYP